MKRGITKRKRTMIQLVLVATLPAVLVGIAVSALWMGFVFGWNVVAEWADWGRRL